MNPCMVTRSLTSSFGLSFVFECSARLAGDDLVQAAAAWINEVRIKKGYNPDSYPNPSKPRPLLRLARPSTFPPSS